MDLNQWNELGVKIWNLWDHVTNQAPRLETIEQAREMLAEMDKLLNGKEVKE